MTHEFVGVIVEPFITRATAHPVVEKILAPFEKNYDEDREELSGWWDYWMVGGRWTGVWVDGYEPHKDPANIDPRPCFICNGTGTRPDIGSMTRAEYIEWCGGCNGCYGVGHQVVSSSRYREIDQDVLSVAELINDQTLRVPRRVVLPDAGIIARDDWDGDRSWDPDPAWNRFVRDQLDPFRNAVIVAVDVHV